MGDSEARISRPSNIEVDELVQKAKEINQKSLIAFLRDGVAAEVTFADMPWIRSLSELPKALERL